MRHGNGLLSHPIDIHFDGFKANLAVLQSRGWDVLLDQHPWDRAFSLAMRRNDLCLITERVHELELHRRHFDSNLVPLPMRIDRVVRDGDRMMSYLPGQARWFEDPVAIDARPAIAPAEHVFNMDDISTFFRKPGAVEAKEIIVGPQNVQQALDLILEMQKDDQAKLRERARSATRQVHAQIVSLAA